MRDLLLDINSCSIEDLRELPLVGAKRAQGIHRFIEQHGPISSLSELADSKVIPKHVARTIAPFVVARDSANDVQTNPVRLGRHRFEGQPEHWIFFLVWLLMIPGILIVRHALTSVATYSFWTGQGHWYFFMTLLGLILLSSLWVVCLLYFILSSPGVLERLPNIGYLASLITPPLILVFGVHLIFQLVHGVNFQPPDAWLAASEHLSGRVIDRSDVTSRRQMFLLVLSLHVVLPLTCTLLPPAVCWLTPSRTEFPLSQARLPILQASFALGLIITGVGIYLLLILLMFWILLYAMPSLRGSSYVGYALFFFYSIGLVLAASHYVPKHLARSSQRRYLLRTMRLISPFRKSLIEYDRFLGPDARKQATSRLIRDTAVAAISSTLVTLALAQMN